LTYFTIIAQKFYFARVRECAAEQKTTMSVTGGAGLQYYTVIMAQNFAKCRSIPTPEAVSSSELLVAARTVDH
jgi:hypothetical protein